MKILQRSFHRCEHCDKILIAPMGNPVSPILLAGDFPGYAEVRQGVPFAFQDKRNPRDSIKAGDILQAELLRVGITLNQVLVTNLWQHQQAWTTITVPPKTSRGKPKEQKVEACPSEWHINELAKLMQERTHVLLMGSTVTEAITGEKAASLYGTLYKSKSFPKVNIWVAPNPSLLFNQPIGEWRLALDRFAEDVHKKLKA